MVQFQDRFSDALSDTGGAANRQHRIRHVVGFDDGCRHDDRRLAVATSYCTVAIKTGGRYRKAIRELLHIEGVKLDGER
jgi:hypothetical protein